MEMWCKDTTDQERNNNGDDCEKVTRLDGWIKREIKMEMTARKLHGWIDGSREK